ncbi:hypothetical protein GCK72_026053 [Caenorhabditis remanei]|uniref:DUF38 domain-containing protein n=1 Tax=Caenorhabditis remanei TaxID=31234 RepID=A0A6A5G4F3_CAERE|nr:hypothetical protein GCK72_026053 [Caenorhabditis remanei]KAF1749585.1 hypothetical protein GCK72_026053 [Caenorhabditis remanei]
MVQTRAQKKFKFTKTPFLVKKEVINVMEFTTNKNSRKLVGYAPRHHFYYMKFANSCRKTKSINVVTEDLTGINEWSFDEFYEAYKSVECKFDTIEFPPHDENVKNIMKFLELKKQWFFLNAEELKRDIEKHPNEPQWKRELFKPFVCKEVLLNLHDETEKYLPFFLRLIDGSKVLKLTMKGKLNYGSYRSIRKEALWKNAETFYCEFCFGNHGYERMIAQHVNYRELAHFQYLDYGAEDITPYKVRTFINSFRDQNHPRGSNFFIYCDESIPYKSILKLYDVKPENQPIPNVDAWHTQVFTLENTQELVLVVVLHQDYVMGKICHVNTIEKDFKRRISSDEPQHIHVYRHYDPHHHQFSLYTNH